MIYTTKNHRQGNSVINIVRTTIQRPAVTVNWGLDHKQETLHHMMIGPNQYFSAWFWKNKYTAEELDQILKRYITTLMTANDNKSKMDVWNIFNEMLIPKEEGGGQ